MKGNERREKTRSKVGAERKKSKGHKTESKPRAGMRGPTGDHDVYYTGLHRVFIFGNQRERVTEHEDRNESQVCHAIPLVRVQVRAN